MSASSSDNGEFDCFFCTLLVGPLFPTGLSGPHFLVLARLGQLGYFVVVVVVLVRVREQVLVGSIHALLSALAFGRGGREPSV